MKLIAFWWSWEMKIKKHLSNVFFKRNLDNQQNPKVLQKFQGLLESSNLTLNKFKFRSFPEVIHYDLVIIKFDKAKPRWNHSQNIINLHFTYTSLKSQHKLVRSIKLWTSGTYYFNKQSSCRHFFTAIYNRIAI